MTSLHWGQWACKCEDEHYLHVSYNMINKVGLLVKKDWPECMEMIRFPQGKTYFIQHWKFNGQWLTNQSLVSQASVPPGVSANLSQHIPSEQHDLQCAHVFPASPSHIQSIWRNLQELSQQRCPHFILGEGSVFGWTRLNTCENSAPRMWRRFEIWGCTRRLEPSVEH